MSYCNSRSDCVAVSTPWKKNNAYFQGDGDDFFVYTNAKCVHINIYGDPLWHMFRKVAFTVSGADGTAEAMNGDWYDYGERNGKPTYANGGNGLFLWVSQSLEWGYLNLGTSGTAKWVAILNGRHRYYNELDTIKAKPLTGWIPRKGAASVALSLNFLVG